MAARKRADISALLLNSPLIFIRLLLSSASRVKWLLSVWFHPYPVARDQTYFISAAFWQRVIFPLQKQKLTKPCWHTPPPGDGKVCRPSKFTIPLPSPVLVVTLGRKWFVPLGAPRWRENALWKSINSRRNSDNKSEMTTFAEAS